MIKDLGTAGDLQEIVKNQMAHSGESADKLFALYLALKDSFKLMSLPSNNHPSLRVWAALKERFPDSNYVKLEGGLRALAENDPGTAADHFACVHYEELDSADQVHVHHVYGNALALRKDFEGAFSLWQKGLALQVDIHRDESAAVTLDDHGGDNHKPENSESSGCPLNEHLYLLEFSKQPEFDVQKNQAEVPASPVNFSPGQAVVSCLRDIYRADQALAQGDFAKAIDVYQDMKLPEVIPLQMAARWTRILLRVAKQQPPLSSSNFDIQLLFHCQNFLNASDLNLRSAWDRDLAQPLPPPLKNWSEADLEQLRAECTDWLSQFEMDRTPPLF